MNKVKLLIILTIPLFFALTGCKSVTIISHNPNFQGKWVANKPDTSYYIEINAKSEIFYQMVTGVITEKYTGTAKYRKSKLIIGLNSFRIGKEPSTDSPNEFIINQVTFKKSE
jgi:hypothetical protein